MKFSTQKKKLVDLININLKRQVQKCNKATFVYLCPLER